MAGPVRCIGFSDTFAEPWPYTINGSTLLYIMDRRVQCDRTHVGSGGTLVTY